jgi:hypothetical protein
MAIEQYEFVLEDGFFCERGPKKTNHLFSCRSSDVIKHLEQGMALERWKLFVQDGFFFKRDPSCEKLAH